MSVSVAMVADHVVCLHRGRSLSLNKGGHADSGRSRDGPGGCGITKKKMSE